MPSAEMEIAKNHHKVKTILANAFSFGLFQTMMDSKMRNG